MRKIIGIIGVFLLTLIYGNSTINANLVLTISSDISTQVDGVTHREIVAEFNASGITSNQVINYMGGNPVGNSNLHVITGDNAHDLYYSRSTVTNMALSINDDYDNYTVIGGINGDFYGTGGVPIEVYIKDGEVVSPGLGYEREVIGFKANGETVFARPCFDGFELIIYSDSGKERIRLDVDKINELPSHEMEISVFFDDVDTEIDNTMNKLIITASNIKRYEYGNTYYGKGIVSSNTELAYTPTWGEFAIVSNNPYVANLAVVDDTVVVHQKASCGFEDVEFAIGGYGKLVENGSPLGTIPSGVGIYDRHPRTAVGVKADGTVFFVTVDGRNAENDMDGMTLYELSELMAYFGAVDAYNLDGGGSTTMIQKSGSSYEILNTPSDGQERLVSNGVFFVKGYNKPKPTKLSIPDLSIELEKPEDVYIDNNNILHWNGILGATSYEISIDGVIKTTTETFYALDVLEEGTHEIQIKALGDGFYYSASRNSRLYEVKILSALQQQILDYFTDYILDEIN